MANQIEGYFTEPLATQLEKTRAILRSKHRITYDCFNALSPNGYVKCRENGTLLRQMGRKGGGLSLYDCLCGLSARVCLDCPWFDTEEEG